MSLDWGTNNRGNYCEALVAAQLIKFGYEVFSPVGGGSRVDLVVQSNGILSKVQVKSSISRKNKKQDKERLRMHKPSVRSKRRFNRPYLKHEVDFFVCVLRDDTCFVIPFDAHIELGNVAGDNPKLNKYREAWHLLNQIEEIKEAA